MAFKIEPQETIKQNEDLKKKQEEEEQKQKKIELEQEILQKQLQEKKKKEEEEQKQKEEKLEQERIRQEIEEQQKKKKQEEEEKKKKIEEKQIKTLTFDLIQYFLTIEPQFELQNNPAHIFDTRIIQFNSRTYTDKIQNKPQNYPNRSSQPRTSYNPNYNKNNGNQQHIRQEGKSNTFVQQNHDIIIERTKEDKDVVEIKMKIKQNAAKFLDHMRQEKLDQNKKQINDIRLWLNILTPSNFEDLKKSLFNYIKEEVLCECIVEGIIEKARTQKLYTGVYANLCKYLILESKFVFKKDENQHNYFKNHLITNIQQTFQGEKSIFEGKMTIKKQKKLEEMNEDEKKQYFDEKKKREMLNLRFIGCLYLNACINHQVMQICIGELINRYVKEYCELSEQQIKNEEVEESHFEDHLEGLILLLDQTGERQCERIKTIKETSKQQQQRQQELNEINLNLINCLQKREYQELNFEKLEYNEYFQFLQWLIQNKKVSPRIDSLTKNLMERKENNWKERISDQANKGPQDQDTIRKEFDEERMKTKLETEEYFKQQQEYQQNNQRYNQRNNQQTIYVQKQPSTSGKQRVQTQQEEFKEVTNAQQKNLSEEDGRNIAKEIWGHLDSQKKFQEDYGIQSAINDFKELTSLFDPVLYGQILIKTVYNCSVQFKENRLSVANEAIKFIKPNEFVQAMNERLNKSKNESADFPLFLTFLSKIFVEFYTKGNASFKDIQVKFKDDFDEDDKEDLVFVFKEFFKECTELIKDQEGFDAEKLLNEQIKFVLEGKDEYYSLFEKDYLKQFKKI
ncbi:mif4g domain protein [Ichthyophthirius multifiliis]|uniref:Mif4g domain protein n=1 Tax=Ichthyophthirius multifiliis TaxID=5932 RepID=G0QZ67_ICHMU|nr:mif4g domain protein [Ichthyophthirius multifiliis]EGR29490.1 mif4g domain protein [Ichthyophthirius multifiliis]|eukprot:XP_004030726.1 mif4g domain protein [Ichthyophthirius multifiliis]